MASAYADTGRESITLTNTSNVAIEVYDAQNSYRFGPGEAKALAGDLAIRLNAQDGRLLLPDTYSEGRLFGNVKPLDQVIETV